MNTSAMAVAMLATTTTLAAPAGADATTDAFLDTLSNAGVTYADPAATTSLGEAVCPMLVQPGKSFASVTSAVGDNGISPDMAAFFTGIAISMYCPSMMSSLGNGSFLDWLQKPGLVPGL